MVAMNFFPKTNFFQLTGAPDAIILLLSPQSSPKVSFCLHFNVCYSSDESIFLSDFPLSLQDELYETECAELFIFGADNFRILQTQIDFKAPFQSPSGNPKT